MKKCSNCEEEISIEKFFIHEPMCIKYTTKCEDCGEILDKGEYEEHKIEFHKIKSCDDCGKKLEARLMNSHKKKCLHKADTCTYCGLSMPKKDLHEHEYLCGSKTESCPECGKLVPIMEFELHLQYTCSAENKKKAPPPVYGKTKHGEHFNNNLDRLKKEFLKCKETFTNLNKNEMAEKNLQVPSNKLNNISKNKYSNNLSIKNKTIDEFICNSPSKKFKYMDNNKNNGLKSNYIKDSINFKNLKEYGSKKTENYEEEKIVLSKEKIEEKIAFVENIKNLEIHNKIPFIKKKENKAHIKNNNYDDHDIEDDFLNDVLEISKYEK